MVKEWRLPLRHDPRIAGFKQDRLPLDIEFRASFDGIAHRFVVPRARFLRDSRLQIFPQPHRDSFPGDQIFLPHFAARRMV